MKEGRKRGREGTFRLLARRHPNSNHWAERSGTDKKESRSVGEEEEPEAPPVVERERSSLRERTRSILVMTKRILS